MIPIRLLNVLKIGVPILLVLIAVNSIYSAGKSSGVEKVTKEWNQWKADQKIATDKQISQLEAAYEKQREDNESLRRELSESEKAYAVYLSGLNSSHALRLQQSEDRASVYQRQAQAGEAESRSLASHAAELDRSLTEGIRLVGELSAVIKLRDAQLIGLGQQILSDRKVIEDGYATTENSDVRSIR